jgi:hypothetical protein
MRKGKLFLAKGAKGAKARHLPVGIGARNPKVGKKARISAYSGLFRLISG